MTSHNLVSCSWHLQASNNGGRTNPKFRNKIHNKDTGLSTHEQVSLNIPFFLHNELSFEVKGTSMCLEIFHKLFDLFGRYFLTFFTVIAVCVKVQAIISTEITLCSFYKSSYPICCDIIPAQYCSNSFSKIFLCSFLAEKKLTLGIFGKYPTVLNTFACQFNVALRQAIIVTPTWLRVSWISVTLFRKSTLFSISLVRFVLGIVLSKYLFCLSLCSILSLFWTHLWILSHTKLAETLLLILPILFFYFFVLDRRWDA